MSNRAFLAQAEEWLLTSGIQDAGTDPRFAGGVHAWYDLHKNSFSFYYTEITGYFLTHMCVLATENGGGRFREAADRSAAWLLTQARDAQSGALLCRYNHDGWLTRACAFDNGMCLNGLLSYHALTGDNASLQAALDIGSWLTGEMTTMDGGFFSKFDTQTQTVQNPGGKWSLISGPFLVKLAIGLLHLAERTGEFRFAEAARTLCEWGLGFQEQDGRVRTSPLVGQTFLHPHCYAAEGWYVAGVSLNDSRFKDAHRHAVEWIAAHQLPSGGFPGYFEGNAFVAVESPDMSAQVYRLWQLLPETQRPAINVAALEQNLLSYQCSDARPEARGGFTSGSAWFHNEKENHVGEHVNSWVTMFTLQALSLAGERGSWTPFQLV